MQYSAKVSLIIKLGLVVIEEIIIITSLMFLLAQGTRDQANKALDMIKRKFPTRRHPELTYGECRPDVPPEPTLPEGLMQVFISCFYPYRRIITIHSFIAILFLYISSSLLPALPVLLPLTIVCF